MSTYAAFRRIVTQVESRSKPFVRGLWLLVAAVAVSGCASQNSSSPSFTDKALDLVGLQSKPAMPEASGLDAQGLSGFSKVSRRITLRLHAGDVLNTDPSGRSLALVARIYKLKGVDAFLQTPYDALKEPVVGKSAPIEGVLDVREVVLTPGQRYEVVETLSGEVTHLAIVGLFRSPDDRRWRFAFDAKDAAGSGITMGAHGCAWSVSEGLPVHAPAETLRLAGVRCR